MPTPRRAPLWTFRMAIGQVTAVLVAATGLAIGTVAYVNATSTVADLSGHIYEADAGFAATLAEEYASSARMTLQLLQASVARGTVSTELDALGPHLVDVLRSNERLTTAGFGNPAGEAIWAEREPDGGMLLRRYDGHASGELQYRHWVVPEQGPWVEQAAEPTDYVATARPWYIAGAASDSHVWTEPYLFLPDHIPGISLVGPATDPSGAAAGVLTVDYQLAFLSHALEDLDRGDGAKGLIFDQFGYVLGHSDPGATSHIDADGTRSIARLDEHSDKVVQLVSELSPEQRVATGGVLRIVRYEGERYAVAVHPTEHEHRLNWRAAVVVPESQLLRTVYRTRLISLGIGAGGVLLAILFSLAFARWLTHSFYSFYEEMERVGQLDLAPRPQPTTLIREVHHLSQHLVGMKASLRSFERYVPAALVRDLISRGIEAVPGGEQREITVLFTDVQGFTTITERMPPKELVAMLSNHLDVLSTVIQQHGGTVDKYIGDAIMAFWNAPGEVPDHPSIACHAALAMTEAVTSSQGSDKPLWPLRIGMATTTAIVGNLGASARLDYTAVGDGVNLASRLEGLNKQYGTRVLISEETARRCSQTHVSRPVDRVIVKGKTLEVTVYELMGPIGDDALEGRAQQTAIAFEHLQQQRADQALQAYGALLTAHPDDPVAKTMVERLRALSA